MIYEFSCPSSTDGNLYTCNGYRIYVDIITWGKFFVNLACYINLIISQFVHSVEGEGMG